jgi:hypothetical protein
VNSNPAFSLPARCAQAGETQEDYALTKSKRPGPLPASPAISDLQFLFILRPSDGRGFWKSTLLRRFLLTRALPVGIHRTGSKDAFGIPS